MKGNFEKMRRQPTGWEGEKAHPIKYYDTKHTKKLHSKKTSNPIRN